MNPVQDIFYNSRGIMNNSRHISIDEEYLKKLQPYINNHNGNIGAALRDIINKAGKFNLRMNSSAIDSSLMNWMLEELDDILVPDEVLDKLINPVMINSMKKLETYINERFGELEFGVKVSIKCDNDALPSGILIEIRGSPQKIKFIAGLLSRFIVKNSLEGSPLEIRSVINFNECMKIEFSRTDKAAAQESMVTFFGNMNSMLTIIKSRPDFWIPIIESHILSNYNMVTIHRNYFEDLLGNNLPMGDVMLEYLAKRPVNELELKDLLYLIKDIYENFRIVNRVEIDNDTIFFFHDYRTKEAADTLKKTILHLLGSNGHSFEAKSTTNMIVLTHRTDKVLQMNELINNLKTSNNRIDQELLIFITLLNGLKDFQDIPLSLTILGRRLGKSIMQEYQKETNIKNWNLDIFRSAFEIIDNKLNRVSEWNMEGGNLRYTVRKCNIARSGNCFDKCLCHTFRETFKGALDYAFGNRAVLDVQKLLTHSDNFCEVVIRIQ